LPSLDLKEPLIGPAAEPQEAVAPMLKPTPRGVGAGPGSSLNRDPASLSAMSSGLAAVVKQQVAARLELAAAYMDLGDEPRARQLLAQTLIDGDEGQRRTAQRLLNQLVRTG
jgi:FimV-like protein